MDRDGFEKYNPAVNIKVKAKVNFAIAQTIKPLNFFLYKEKV